MGICWVLLGDFLSVWCHVSMPCQSLLDTCQPDKTQLLIEKEIKKHQFTFRKVPPQTFTIAIPCISNYEHVCIHNKTFVALRLDDFHSIILRLASLPSSELHFIPTLLQKLRNTMAAFSALKNKKNKKMREGIEDLALKCSESSEKDDLNIKVG